MEQERAPKQTPARKQNQNQTPAQTPKQKQKQKPPPAQIPEHFNAIGRSEGEGPAPWITRSSAPESLDSRLTS